MRRQRNAGSTRRSAVEIERQDLAQWQQRQRSESEIVAAQPEQWEAYDHGDDAVTTMRQQEMPSDWRRLRRPGSRSVYAPIP